MKPTLALFTGDPAGIGPEILAHVLADRELADSAHLLVIGSAKVVAEGMRVAGAELALSRGAATRAPERPRLVEWEHVDAGGFARSEVSAVNGRYMLDGLALGVDLCRRGIADAMCFAPLNKAALRAGGMAHADELHYFSEILDFRGPCVEFNILDGLWTSRVTSHVPHKDVSALITRERVAEGVELLTSGLHRAGHAHPRIAVCGLNPHNGDNGAFGREEIDVIGPGVELARQRGFPADGPFPADTAFVRALRKGGEGYDGVLTMYHDQGQIAMKLLGFERGVTVPGGLPVAIATPAHGTAYDIAGRAVANAGAMKNAFRIARGMAVTARAGS